MQSIRRPQLATRKLSPGHLRPHIVLKDYGQHVGQRVLHLALPHRRHVFERAQGRERRGRLEQLLQTANGRRHTRCIVSRHSDTLAAGEGLGRAQQ